MRSNLMILGVMFVAAGSANAELLDPVTLTPSNNHYVALGPSQTPVAWTFANDADVWQIDLTAFTAGAFVKFTAWDWFPPYPDDYDLFWNGTFVGNSWAGSAGVGQVFNVVGTSGINLLRVEYVNKNSGFVPESGGSYYNLDIKAEPVPEPASMIALGLGLFGALRRKRSAAKAV